MFLTHKDPLIYKVKYILSNIWCKVFSLFFFETQAPLSFLSSGWLFKPQLSDCPWVSYLLGITVHMELKICFPPVNLSYVNLITRPAKELSGEKGKFFPPLHCLPASLPYKNTYKGCFWDSFHTEPINTGMVSILLRNKLQHVNWRKITFVSGLKCLQWVGK